jgi:hypothetical protein
MASFYFSGFGLLQGAFLVAFIGYLMLIFVIAAVLLKSFRWGFKAAFSALVTVAFLSLIHKLSFPAYDSLAPVAYFAVLLLSFLINMLILHGRFVKKKALFIVYAESKFAITFVVVSTIIMGLVIASQPLLEQFGLLSMVGAALAYLVMLFFLAPFIRLEGEFQGMEKLSEEERRVKNFVTRYGKGRELHPFFASWLGSAVAKVEDYIDSLEAKGYLGHNFFSVHNFLFWGFTTTSFLMGAASANGSLLVSLLPFTVLIGGIVLLAPQSFMKRRTRRLSGILVLIAAMTLLYLWGYVPLKFGTFTALLALVSVYFAYQDDEIVSMVFASFFTGSLFVLGYSLWKVPIILTPAPWIITFTLFLLLVYEYYTRSA